MMDIPVEWYKEVIDAYTPIRTLGKGAFASVVLARDKTTDAKVAIKVIGNPSTASISERETSLKYAKREIEILRQLDHPNIMKVEKYWDSTQHKDAPRPNTTCIMALSYSKGPTVESLLHHGGALSIVFGRVVVAQVVSALAYIHYRGVVHRDIKPDNIIVSGAVSKDDQIWDNIGDESAINWPELRKKWKCTLVDFGFARALTRNNICGSEDLMLESRTSGFMEILDSEEIRRRISCHSITNSKELKRSMSHRTHHRFTALGNRNFAAPEIINKVYQDKSAKDSASGTFSEYVADYGLLVDSYSLGHTIRYMMTGVLPTQSVEEAIRAQNSVCSKLCGGKKNDGKRTVRYRTLSELPREVRLLIQQLTEIPEAKRLSIRKARRTVPWISYVFSGDEEVSEEQKHNLSDISFLNE